MPRYVKPSDRTVVLFGRAYRIKFVRARDKGLWCNNQFNLAVLDDVHSTIYVRYTQHRKDIADCLLHELLHAACRTLYEAEGFVTEVATIASHVVVDVLDEIDN
jgi:hypothetical protein